MRKAFIEDLKIFPEQGRYQASVAICGGNVEVDDFGTRAERWLLRGRVCRNEKHVEKKRQTGTCQHESSLATFTFGIKIVSPFDFDKSTYRFKEASGAFRTVLCVKRHGRAGTGDGYWCLDFWSLARSGQSHASVITGWDPVRRRYGSG